MLFYRKLTREERSIIVNKQKKIAKRKVLYFPYVIFGLISLFGIVVIFASQYKFYAQLILYLGFGGMFFHYENRKSIKTSKIAEMEFQNYINSGIRVHQYHIEKLGKIKNNDRSGYIVFQNIKGQCFCVLIEEVLLFENAYSEAPREFLEFLVDRGAVLGLEKSLKFKGGEIEELKNVRLSDSFVYVHENRYLPVTTKPWTTKNLRD